MRWCQGFNRCWPPRMRASKKLHRTWATHLEMEHLLISYCILILPRSLLCPPTPEMGLTAYIPSLQSRPITQIHACIFFSSFSFSPLTCFLACQICFSSSSGIILPLWDTDWRRPVMFSSEHTSVQLFFKVGISPSTHQVPRSCPHYLPSVSTKQMFSVPIPRKEAAFFME